MEEEYSVLEDCEKWIALYWTLPVPWARDKNRPNGHIELSKDADIAAEQSKTIQFQQALVRREVKEAKRQLIDEVPYMEADAFRPGQGIIDALKRIAARCRAEGAGFVYVRFGGPYRVRYHRELESYVESSFIGSGIKCAYIPVDPPENLQNEDDVSHNTRKPKFLSSGVIEPFSHFRAWKAADQARKDERERQIKKISEIFDELRSRGKTFSQVAAQLNSREIYSTTGKLWTADSLRKFVSRTRVSA